MTQDTPASVALKMLTEAFASRNMTSPALFMAEAALAGRGFVYTTLRMGSDVIVTAAYADVETAKAALLRTAWAQADGLTAETLEGSLWRHGVAIHVVEHKPSLSLTDILLCMNGGEVSACTVAAFIRANCDMGEELADVLDTLERGEDYQGGGGAAPLFTVARLKSASITVANDLQPKA